MRVLEAFRHRVAVTAVLPATSDARVAFYFRMAGNTWGVNTVVELNLCIPIDTCGSLESERTRSHVCVKHATPTQSVNPNFQAL